MCLVLARYSCPHTARFMRTKSKCSKLCTKTNGEVLFDYPCHTCALQEVREMWVKGGRRSVGGGGDDEEGGEEGYGEGNEGEKGKSGNKGGIEVREGEEIKVRGRGGMGKRVEEVKGEGRGSGGTEMNEKGSRGGE